VSTRSRQFLRFFDATLDRPTADARSVSSTGELEVAGDLSVLRRVRSFSSRDAGPLFELVVVTRFAGFRVSEVGGTDVDSSK